MKKGYDWEYSLVKEKESWLAGKQRICSSQWLEHVKQRTEWFLNWYKLYGIINEKSTILHVGSGAEGEINFISEGNRVAIDPLSDFYKLHFSDIMNKDVDYLKGRGENLPFEDNSFDLVISWNSLDHTEYPIKVLSEITRVLKKNGIFYLGIHTRSQYGLLVFNFNKKVRTKIDHYYSYTRADITKEVSIFLKIEDTKEETPLMKNAPSRIEINKFTMKNFLIFSLLGQREFIFLILARKL
jgi:SAM-dependent methyltransferase